MEDSVLRERESPPSLPAQTALASDVQHRGAGMASAARKTIKAAKLARKQRRRELEAGVEPTV